MNWILAIAIATLVPLTSWSCSQSSDFSGGGKRTAAEQAECDADADTVAELVTTEVKNNDPDNQIEYQISVTNCDGEKVKLDAKNIKFDIGAVSSKGKTDPEKPFIAKVGETTIEGTMERVDGSDLFGNSGEKFFHNQTDKPLTLPEGTTDIAFIIKLKGASFKALSTASDPDSQVFPTYLAFGDAKVVQKDVQFVGEFVSGKK